MGPIRAFSRPSLAAGEFATSASPYSHTSGYSTVRRPCCAHSSSSFGAQHSALPHPHFYNSVCAADPLHAGLVASPAAPLPCLIHFKTLLPPGAAPPSTHLVVSARQDSGSASQGASRGTVGHEKRNKAIYEHGWKNSDGYQWKNKDERKLKKKNCESPWKNHKQEVKWKQPNGAHKRNAKKSEYQWEKLGDPDLWRRKEDEGKRKNKKDKLKWNKPHREHHGVRSEEENEYDSERIEVKAAPAAASPPGSGTEDPCTSRFAFPFSDDDDDDDYGHKGKGKEGSNEESWPISDIVETEDEEGENQGEHVQVTSSQDCDPTCPVSASVYSALSDAEPAGEVQQQQLLPTAGNQSSVSKQNDAAEGESATSALRITLEWQDSPPKREKGELPKESDGDEENELEEQMGPDNEERRPEEEESPRDGVRVTQRLRPRSYRQFLLTRERRSRVFLKARSYHLGRWFVTHFTHPYPSKEQKDQLASLTSMNRNQVSEWFGNMRRRIREATRGLGVCWEERVRLYNTVITGKSEPLPIQPGDAINTWVPPVAEEPSSLDLQEEVCASPKFKKALIERYNNSFEASPTHASGEDTRPPSTPAPLTQPEEDLSLSQGHHKSFESFESSKSSPVTSHVLPLCTSSPKESFQARWNTSFQHVKDTKFPAVATRFLDKSDARVKPFSGRGQAEEDGRIIRKYERQRNQDYSSTSFKRQRPDRDPCQSFNPCTSSSLPLEHRQAAGEGWRTLASTSTAQFLSSSFVTMRSSDEEGGAGRCVRKPEELAAAYTLMELHTDAAAAYPMPLAPRPSPLSS